MRGSSIPTSFARSLLQLVGRQLKTEGRPYIRTGIAPSTWKLCFPSSTFRPYHRSTVTMTGKLEIELTAPNGKKWVQPTGLFINNEFVPGNGGTITSIDPAYVILLPAALKRMG